MDRVSNATLESMIKNVEEFERSTKLGVKETKKLVARYLSISLAVVLSTVGRLNFLNKSILLPLTAIFSDTDG